MKTEIITKEKSNNLFKKVAKKLSLLATGIVGAFLEMPTMVYAGKLGETSVSIKEDVDADAMFGRIAGLVLDVARFVGAVLVIMGIVKLVIALNNDQADQIKGSVMMIVSGIVMVGLKTILGTMGLI